MHGPDPTKEAPSFTDKREKAKEGKAVAALGRGESTCM
jgi:hypothetical protein